MGLYGLHNKSFTLLVCIRDQVDSTWLQKYVWLEQAEHHSSKGGGEMGRENAPIVDEMQTSTQLLKLAPTQRTFVFDHLGFIPSARNNLSGLFRRRNGYLQEVFQSIG